MAVTVELWGQQYRVHGGKWSGGELGVRTLIDAKILLADLRLTLSQADSDYSLADWVVQNIGGEIVGYKPPEYVPGRVY